MFACISADNCGRGLELHDVLCLQIAELLMGIFVELRGFEVGKLL